MSKKWTDFYLVSYRIQIDLLCLTGYHPGIQNIYQYELAHDCMQYQYSLLLIHIWLDIQADLLHPLLVDHGTRNICPQFPSAKDRLFIFKRT